MPLKEKSRRVCRQCGRPLQDGVRFNVVLCPQCKKANAERINRENNRKWYLKNKEKVSLQRSEKYRKTHKVAHRSVVQERIPSKEEIKNNIDRIIRNSEILHSLLDRRRDDDFELVDTPYGPVCKNPIVVKHSAGIEDTAVRSFSETIVNGREMIIETRGQFCGTIR